MMWIIHPVFIIITHWMFHFNVLAANNCTPPSSTTNSTSTEATISNVLHWLLYAIICNCFFAFLVVILLIILFKMFIKMKNDLRRETIHSDMEESTVLRHTNALSVSSPSGDGGDNSSSTSSGTPQGSLVDLSRSSQRYASLQDRSKASDYINVSESALPGRVDFQNKKMDKDFVNVKESGRKKINRKGQASCDGTTSVSSEESLNYSKVVFTKIDK